MRILFTMSIPARSLNELWYDSAAQIFQSGHSAVGDVQLAPGDVATNDYALASTADSRDRRNTGG